MKKLLIAVTFATALSVPLTAFANPSPPTEGGNGGGSSGQCTGAPVDRPAVCPGT